MGKVGNGATLSWLHSQGQWGEVGLGVVAFPGGLLGANSLSILMIGGQGNFLGDTSIEGWY